jgi:hypothetical protein
MSEAQISSDHGLVVAACESEAPDKAPAPEVRPCEARECIGVLEYENQPSCWRLFCSTPWR